MLIALLCVLLALMPLSALAEEVTVPSGTDRVTKDAFMGDVSIRSAVVPEGVERIEEGAFGGCAALEEIRLPSTLSYIDDTAFSGCDLLAVVYAPAHSRACEWALLRGFKVRDAETGEELTPFSDDPALEDAACAAYAEQIVLVEYSGGSKALVTLHEKRGGMWETVESSDGLVGKNGIGKTREGDKRTPTGEYHLTTPFGIEDDPGSAMPYLKVTQYHYWCGTSGDPLYNRLVDERESGRARTKADEHLIDIAPYYDYAMFIDYNAEGEAGKGSCIFLHCKGPRAYTSGCIAVDRAFMIDILRRAREGAMIVIR